MRGHAYPLGASRGRLIGLALCAAGCGELSAESTLAPAAQEPAPEAASAPADELAELRASLAACAAELDLERAAHAAQRDEVARLSAELRATQERSFERELAWHEYNRTIAGLDLDAIDLLFRAQGLALPEPEPEPTPEDPLVVAERTARATRAAEIHSALGVLFRAEEVRGLDLLSAGTLGDGWVGPVVFRLLDGDGRLSGSLVAARLWLEGSFAGHTLTLVLEDGYESHGGARTPFAGGARRILLPSVDPGSWIEAFPEIFGAAAEAAVLDDGTHDVARLRTQLNELLAADAEHGYWKLRSLAGVAGDELTRVHLAEHDAAGRLVRRVFADRLRILRRGSAVVLELEDGTCLRGDEKTAFREGRMHIYLPRAAADAWARAGIPGLAAAEPEPAIAPEPAATPESEPDPAPQPAPDPTPPDPEDGRA